MKIETPSIKQKMFFVVAFSIIVIFNYLEKLEKIIEKKMHID
jgi:hypothetical protein